MVWCCKTFLCPWKHIRWRILEHHRHRYCHFHLRLSCILLTFLLLALFPLHINSTNYAYIEYGISQFDISYISLYMGIYCVIFDFIMTNSINWFKSCHKNPLCPKSRVTDESIYGYMSLKIFSHIFLSLRDFGINGCRGKLPLLFYWIDKYFGFRQIFYFFPSYFYSFLVHKFTDIINFFATVLIQSQCNTDLNWLMSSYTQNACRY